MPDPLSAISALLSHTTKRRPPLWLGRTNGAAQCEACPIDNGEEGGPATPDSLQSRAAKAKRAACRNRDHRKADARSLGALSRLPELNHPPKGQHQQQRRIIQIRNSPLHAKERSVAGVWHTLPVLPDSITSAFGKQALARVQRKEESQDKGPWRLMLYEWQ